MKRERRKFTNAFKTEVVLEALKEKKNLRISGEVQTLSDSNFFVED